MKFKLTDTRESNEFSNITRTDENRLSLVTACGSRLIGCTSIACYNCNLDSNNNLPCSDVLSLLTLTKITNQEKASIHSILKESDIKLTFEERLVTNKELT